MPAKETPAQAGFHMPAEWEHHEATWIGWPHNRTDWPGKFAPIPWVYGEIVRKIARGEKVRIIVESASHESSARKVLKKAGVDPAMTEFFRFPTDRGWARDFGPIAVRRVNETAFVGFLFNALGEIPELEEGRARPRQGSEGAGREALRRDTQRETVRS